MLAPQTEARVNRGDAVTRAEAEHMIRSVTRRCRGPQGPDTARVLARMKLAPLPDEVRAALAEELPPVTHDACVALLEDGHRKAADLLNRASRAGCGYDFNLILLAIPWDGQPRTAECPQCGVLARFTPPIIHLLPDEGSP